MENKLIFIILAVISFISSCSNDKSKQNESQLKTTTSKVETMALDSVSACYSYSQNNDTVVLHLSRFGDRITGDLIYKWFQKDSNTGTIHGQMKEDTIFAEYTFVSEGNESVREVAFLKKGENLVEGYGEVKAENNKTVFVSRKTLNFDTNTILNKTECTKDKYGCITSVGYTWSVLKNACIKLGETAILRLNPIKMGGTVRGEAAFIVFSEDQQEVELFLPTQDSSVIMKRTGQEGSHHWESDNLMLYPWKGYTLKRNDSIIYAGQ